MIGFMAILPLHALRAALAATQRLIGIDPGSRTIGLALSDALSNLLQEDIDLALRFGVPADS